MQVVRVIHLNQTLYYGLIWASTVSAQVKAVCRGGKVEEE